MASGPIKRTALSEVVMVDDLQLNVNGSTVRQLRRYVEDGDFCLRIFSRNLSGNEFQVDDPVVVIKQKSRVDKDIRNDLPVPPARR